MNPNNSLSSYRNIPYQYNPYSSGTTNTGSSSPFPEVSQAPSASYAELVTDVGVEMVKKKHPYVGTLNDFSSNAVAAQNLSRNIHQSINAGQSPTQAYTCQTMKTVIKEGATRFLQDAIVGAIPEYAAVAMLDPLVATTIPLAVSQIPKAYQRSEDLGGILGQGAEDACNQAFDYVNNVANNNSSSASLNNGLGTTYTPYQPYGGGNVINTDTSTSNQYGSTSFSSPVSSYQPYVPYGSSSNSSSDFIANSNSGSNVQNYQYTSDNIYGQVGDNTVANYIDTSNNYADLSNVQDDPSDPVLYDDYN